MQGTYAFSKRSNLKYKRLLKTEKNNVRLETLQEAANIIIDCMVNLPIFDLYFLSGHKHGSNDGTKEKIKRKLLKARHSPKYFGLDIGEVVMTMNLGHIPLATQVIGANEHESHYIFPMLYQNNSVVDPDIISTDTAGTNNINDLLYFLVGKLHAACYRSLPDKAKALCGFEDLDSYESYIIKPTKKVDIKFIEKKWPEVVPILASILSHDTKQERVIKQLSSHDYKSDVKKAIWELNKIVNSIHILTYIDDENYRRDIRTSLNRGEAYHQLRNKIADVGGGDFRGMSDLEVEIWNECNRFIALIIIYYNMHLLSKLYENALAKNDKAAMAFLKKISPIASQHINIAGLYEFSEILADIDVDTVVEVLSKILNETISQNQTKDAKPSEKKKKKQATVA